MSALRKVFDDVNRRKPKGSRIFEGYLRLESADLATQKQITFYISKDSAAQAATVTENRLAKTDSFVATSIGFGLIKTTTTLITQNMSIHTFPDSLVFTGSSEAANLNQIYNGSLQISIDGVINVSAFPMLKFLRVGQAQEAVLTAASGTGNAYVRSQWDANTFPNYPLASYLTFNGASNVEINVNCPVSQSMVGTSSQNKAVLFFYGILIQNGANYNSGR